MVDKILLICVNCKYYGGCNENTQDYDLCIFNRLDSSNLFNHLQTI